MRYDFFNISGENRDDWEAICPLNQYRVLPPNELPGPLPSGLTTKYDSVVIASSGTTGGTAFFMINGNKIRPKSRRN